LAFIGELLSEVLAEAGPRVGLTQYHGPVSAALGQCLAEPIRFTIRPAQTAG